MLILYYSRHNKRGCTRVDISKRGCTCSVGIGFKKVGQKCTNALTIRVSQSLENKTDFWNRLSLVFEDGASQTPMSDDASFSNCQHALSSGTVALCFCSERCHFRILYDHANFQYITEGHGLTRKHQSTVVPGTILSENAKYGFTGLLRRFSEMMHMVKMSTEVSRKSNAKNGRIDKNRLSERMTKD